MDVLTHATPSLMPRSRGAAAAAVSVYLVVASLVVLFLGRSATIISPPADALPLRFVLVPSVGLGGGGGGSPAPAPPKMLAVPATPQPPSVVVVPTPIPEPPLPTLTAAIVTSPDAVAQAAGTSVTSLATLGGGGSGPGLGPGAGTGVGPGREYGFGGDIPRGGAGVRPPTVIREVQPSYTSAAMLAKIQGSVRLEAIVDASGAVTDVRVTRSLDRRYGLDEQAMNAARQWVFRPARDRDSHPVPVVIEFDLAFALH